MLLTLSTTHHPATDLGFLLHKNPERVHTLELTFGRAHMLYPEANAERCTFALVLDVDPVALVRGKGARDGGRTEGLLDQYVNDRPYAASSFLSVAIAKALRTALGGRSNERAALADTPIPLTATVEPLPVRGPPGMLERLFAPLGYRITARPIPLDDKLATDLGPAWGESPYVALTLEATCRLKDLLAHLYVLIPVLDRQKHYYVADSELEKLIDKGAGWLAGHPERELIVQRYLRFKRSLTSEALARLAEEPDADGAIDMPPTDVAVAPASDAGAATATVDSPEAQPPARPKDAAEEALEQPIRLHDMRLDAVAEVLRKAGVRRVVDLGCGSGKLLRRLLAEKQFEEILGVDISTQSLAIAERRLRLERMSERQRQRIRLVQGALTYRDKRIAGFDAAALVEVIEHLEPDRLAAMARVVLGEAKPGLVVVTTPNVEYNVRFPTMHPGQMRHADHRFEWTRAEFRGWAEPIAARYGYGVTFHPLGEEDAVVGAPSQMAVFERA